MDRHANEHGAYCVTPLPGQPQVAVTHAFFVRPGSRGKGHGKKLKAEQLQKLRDEAFDYGICTVRADNLVQKSVLKKTGWHYLDEFKSAAQGAWIEIWGGKVEQ